MKRVFAGFTFAVALAVLSPWLAAALQEPAAPAAALPSLRESRAELQQLTDAAKHEAAAQLIASVLARPDWSAADERERAEFHFAAGVSYGAAQSYDEAALAAHAARGLSGSSELGLASAYNAGTFRLLRAEQLRLEIPEVRQALKLPPLTPATPGANPQAGSAAGPAGVSAGGGPPGVEQAADPLGVARAAYLAARADLVERWRADLVERWRADLVERWRADPADVDTRANLELAVRRLRELDELEREREEQKQDPNERQDQDQKQDPQQQDSQQDKGEEPKDGEQQEKPEDSEPKSPEDKPEDSGEDKQPEDKQEQPDPKADEQDPSKPEENEPKDGAEPAKPEDERLLTPEEIQRLLQQLDKIEDQAAQVQAALRRARRVPVKKDW